MARRRLILLSFSGGLVPIMRVSLYETVIHVVGGGHKAGFLNFTIWPPPFMHSSFGPSRARRFNAINMRVGGGGALSSEGPLRLIPATFLGVVFRR